MTVSVFSDTLFVTLSNEFLNTMSRENKNYTSNETDLATVMSRRRLAIYSIVNTVTEIGNYSRVQILISDRNNPSGYRPTMYNVGFSTSDDGKFLDTLPRSPEVVLTPQNAVSKVLSLMQEKQWEEVYKCLYQGESSANATISAYDFNTQASKSNLLIENFSVKNQVTYNSNGVAVANVNFTVRTGSGSTEYTQVPIRVVLYNNIWKVEYSSISKIFKKVN
ncbi:MAG: GerMN domain-containing protein [Lachnospiraceae bacterium]|nr:GerMN domain-containing protein [Lachnospiraceae bacterium]